MEGTKKELVLAIVLGLLFGIIVAGGFWLARTGKLPAVKTPSEEPRTEQKITPAAETPTPTLPFSLELFSPENESVVNTKNIDIRGKTAPNALVIVSLENEDKTLTSDSSGDFSTNASLNEGENIISITSFGPNDEEASLDYTVIYEKE